MNYYLKKFITLIITLFLVSVLAFLAFQVISDPATSILGTNATPESLAALRHQMGLDRPIPVQYFDWLSNFLTGHFGTSYSYKLPVGEMIAQKLPLTICIVMVSFVMMVAGSIPLGIYCAKHQGSTADNILTIVCQVAMSIPAFLLGVGLTYLFGIALHLFTPGTYVGFFTSPLGWFRSIIFPSLAIAIPRVAMVSKMLRTSILEQMDQNYIRTAYSRGASRTGALKRHAFRNGMLPVITFIGSSMAEIVTSCILIEQVFALPGVGVLLLSSIGNRDFPVVLTLVMMIAAWVIVVNFIADLCCQMADPRVRMQ